MEQKIKNELVKSANSIKKKIKLMKTEDDFINLNMNKFLRPVAEPLKTLIELDNKNISSIKNNDDDDAKNTSSLCSNSSDCTKYDGKNDVDLDDDYDEFLECNKVESPYKVGQNSDVSLSKEEYAEFYNNLNISAGIRSDNKKMYMGNSEVKISKLFDRLNNDQPYFITIEDKRYELTSGIKELLFHKKPNLELITEQDRRVYKDMLYHTNAHKRDFDPNGQIKGDKSIRYREIIRPLFSKGLDKKFQTTPKLGGCLPKLKQYRRNVDLVYWDDPNELIDRLKLLILSRDAGNSNHDNEIISIIEELKEAGIIKE